MPHHVSPTRPFGALLTAMVTPMKPSGEIDVDAAVALAKRLAAHGHDGVVLNGTTGEAPATHAPEKVELVTAVVEAVGDDLLVVAGAGSNDTAHAVRQAEQAAQAGAHGLLVVTPYYSRPSQEGIYQHTRAVVESTDLPVMLYDVPGRTVVRYTEGTLDRLAALEQVVAIKDATGDVYAAAKGATRTGLAYYSGDDPLLLAYLANGAVGVVSMAAHLVGSELRAVIDAFDEGDTALAFKRFTDVADVIDLVCGSGNGALRSKTALALLGHIPDPTMRLPNVAADVEETELVRAALVAAGLLENR
ncbi:MAG: 4-hydroxy-tetrahydrodipicolinate synthase [Actinomycetota bacterium]|nr:4-hydroxy-tetrahydrodipicolinate synthase [Actinomycetota bacterium]MDQ2698567.1 4-hydroxy-tetrahydrodipicolinate synthase [Actinomycetota bacterium]